VAGCNGDSDGYGNGSCYQCGANYCNGKLFEAGGVYFSDGAGPYYKNDWHFVEAYFKLNSISGGIGQADGKMQYWFDGELIINKQNAVLRTGQYPAMKFNQFIIGPYMGSSAANQTFWIDNLKVATERSPVNPPPAPPTGLKVVQ
jgi:hypothetical protein